MQVNVLLPLGSSWWKTATAAATDVVIRSFAILNDILETTLILNDKYSNEFDVGEMI